MNDPSLTVVGAGGFGRETLDVIDAVNRSTPGTSWTPLVVDDSPSDINLSRLEARRIPFAGAVEDWFAEHPGLRYVLAVGNPQARRDLHARLSGFDAHPVTLVHPSAVLGSVSHVAAGSVICAGVQISTNVRLGEHVHVNAGVLIGHDAVLEPFVSVNPGAVISGECLVGSGSLIGANSTILQGLGIGAGATVGAAACVVNDVPPGKVVKGVPAR